MAKVDWDAIEPEWRAGIKSKKQISEEFGVSRAALDKHFAKEGISRDLNAKIQAEAEAKVTRSLVTPEVTQSRRVTEKMIVKTNSDSIADVVLRERKDIADLKDVASALLAQLKEQINNSEEIKEIARVLADGDDKEMSSTLRKVISLPGQADTLKKLVETMKIIIELERKVLRIKDEPDAANTVVVKADPTLSPADAYLRMLGKK